MLLEKIAFNADFDGKNSIDLNLKDNCLNHDLRLKITDVKISDFKCVSTCCGILMKNHVLHRH